LFFLCEVTEFQSFQCQHFPNFDQTGLAKVFAGKQILFRVSTEVGKRHNTHRFEAISAPYRQFKVGDRQIQNLAYPILSALRLFINVHFAGSLCIFEEEPRSAVGRLCIGNTLEANDCLVIQSQVFVQNAEIEERTRMCRKSGNCLLIQIKGFFVISATLGFHCKTE
jgi:hypothetical protein